jgi:hypothetical protein
MLATWCTDGRGEESEVALKVGVRYCSRQCSREKVRGRALWCSPWEGDD